MAMNSPYSHYFITHDGAILHYLDRGEGHPLVLLPTYNISCQIFKSQLDELSQKYRIIALDMRGHGLSTKINYGYTVYRFAKDLHELLNLLHLNKLYLLGHNFGGSVACAYLELFGFSHIDKLILIDRSAMPMANPYWKAVDIQQFGASTDATALEQLCNQICSNPNNYFMQVLFDTMVSRDAADKLKQFILNCSDTLPKRAAARLLFDAYYQDWRTLFPRIPIPSLIIGGQASLISPTSQVWVSKQIPNAKLIIFEEDEGGKHFPFVENPKKFNRVVDKFIQS
ncbi:alpha/beta hydrolase [uncultured Shewanella sp.]|uniref:alpha/beta fold hydrolase n=1 Tax=uncultured Shewanella sp. TaxID=173975 RepID=UPI002613F46F|nr:alpha/beta hydrolase [uncultured Shewanella sp.]